MTTASPNTKDRLVVKAHFDRHGFMTHVTLPRTRHTFGTVLHFKESPAQTPSGGKYIRRAFTLRAPGGRKWVGTLKKDSDTVTMRPAKA